MTNSSSLLNNHFLTNRKEIVDWLDSYKILNYTIHPDLTVDVNSSVHLELNGLTFIPVQFGTVNGHFNCNQNSLTSLKGCPKIVTGDFNCHQNELTSLEHSPSIVGRDFHCRRNMLTNLEFCPDLPGGALDARNNQISSLEFIPKALKDYAKLDNNTKNYGFFSTLEDLQKARLFEIAQKEREQLSVTINEAKPINVTHKV